MNLSPETLKHVYSEMVRIRLIEERIADLYQGQEMRCPTHLSIGQEAVAVGVCANLMRQDNVLSGHRSHAHYLAKGGDLRKMMAEIYGKATGCSRGKGGSMHLIDLAAGFLGATPIVGSTIPIAAGVAFAAQMKGERSVSVAFFGDAAAEEGVLHETLNFAVLMNLPIVFVCENNLYSVYSPMAVRQSSKRQIFEIARGHGMESCQGDGNDVVGVFALAQKAVGRARRGEGPTFLEFMTYRWREHCGPLYDNDLGYRSPSEFERWRRRCPIDKLRRQLMRDGVLSQGDVDAMMLTLQADVEDAINFAKASPFPNGDALYDQVYA